MEYPAHHPLGLSPDELPQVDMAWARAQEPTVEPDSETLHRFKGWLGRLQPPSASETKTLCQPSAAAPPIDGVIGVPVHVEKETVAGIQATFRAIGDSAAAADKHVLLLVDLNYPVNERREAEQLWANRHKAAELAVDIEATVRAHEAPVSLLIQQHESDYGATIARTRKRMLESAARFCVGQETKGDFNPWAVHRYPLTPNWAAFDAKLAAVYTLPFMNIDADSQPDRTAVGKLFDVATSQRTLFANGTLHYIGGVLDKPVAKAAVSSADERLIYATEMLRRTMFDHLPATAFRGYLPESGLTAQIGMLANLEGYNTKDQNNESYWLQVRAIEALRKVMPFGGRPPKPRNPVGHIVDDAQPYVGYTHTRGMTSLVRYEDCIITTSGRGIEALVRDKGRQALAGFDEGAAYTLWTEQEHNSTAALRGPEPSAIELSSLMNDIYSYLSDCGGALRAHEIQAYDALLQRLFPAHRMRWYPEYVAAEKRGAV